MKLSSICSSIAHDCLPKGTYVKFIKPSTFELSIKVVDWVFDSNLKEWKVNMVDNDGGTYTKRDYLHWTKA